MSKIIKVSTDLEVTVHDFPQGNMREQNRALYELIGNGCDMIEHVMPVRLYNELGHSNHVKRSNSKCVSMLIDEEGLLKDNEVSRPEKRTRAGTPTQLQQISGNMRALPTVWRTTAHIYWAP